MKSMLNVNLYLKVFSFHMFSAWAKFQIVDINIQCFSENSALCAEFPMGLKFYFFQWKTYSSRFIAKFLKFVLIPYSFRYI